MPLIRRQNAASLVRDAVVLDLGDLARQGELIKQQARDQADAILKEARHKAQQIRQSAVEEGRKTGYAKGIEEGTTQGLAQGRQSAHDEFARRLTELEQSWNAALDTFTQRRHTMLTGLQHDVILLATSMARAVVNRVVKTNPDVILDQVAASIDLVSHRSALTIRIHPDDHDLVEAALPDLLKRMRADADARLLTDESIARGGCAIDANGVEVDADLDTQIARLVDALLPDDGTGTRASGKSWAAPADKTTPGTSTDGGARPDPDSNSDPAA